jgi:leucyl-tRNA synthetase
MTYDFKKIEKKWLKAWDDAKAFTVSANKKKPKFYNLEMFPYPSGEGLHMGHALNYTIGDIRARFKRAMGFNVLYPMGYDSFGLPAENAAIKAGVHPRKYTSNAIKNFIVQQKALGLSYDWSKILSSCEPIYYKWNQFFFLKFLEKGLVYKKKAAVNWCSKCDTVLANEQVHNGKCWRHEDTEVEVKQLEQWFIKTTDYAEELLDTKDLNWPQRIKTMQKNWIGKSHGTEIDFEIETPAHEGCTLESETTKWPIFTTRPDTLYGVTFMVVSAQHPRLGELVNADQEKDVEKFLKKLKSVSEKELDAMEKEGVFTGSYAINPLTGDKVPVYAGNFVVADYGSGMVMAVPAHDKRDFAFAKKYGIDIKLVIQPKDFEIKKGKLAEAYVGGGTLVNSDKFDGLDNDKVKEEITKFLIKKKVGRKKVQFKLRDWLISRQRYWGTPIPIVYCDKCGVVPVPEKDLPVKLPEKVKFGKGNPLATNKEFLNVACPKCGAKAQRETDTMDTFVDSSWYYMRFPDNLNEKSAFDKKISEYWLPVDTYIGGAEHATMHLLYARFWTKALRDLGYINYDEPFKQLFNQGMLHAPDGNKMSKSLGNVINPIDMVKKYGLDSLRLALMSFASPDSDTNWDEKVLVGSFKFLNKVYDKFENIKVGKSDGKIESKLNKVIKEVTNQFENFKYNLAIIKIRDLFNSLGAEESKEVLEKSLKLLAPICPCVAEDLWVKIKCKGMISLSAWPKEDEKKIDDSFEKAEQAVDKLVGDIAQIKKMTGKEKAKVYVYVLPNELKIYKDVEGINLFAVNDKDKHDPENKSKKVKPNRPGIYLA